MVALLLVVLVPSSAMAVDLGMQRVVRRDMQTLADVVALDVVRLVDGRTASQIHGRLQRPADPRQRRGAQPWPATTTTCSATCRP